MRRWKFYARGLSSTAFVWLNTGLDGTRSPDFFATAGVVKQMSLVCEGFGLRKKRR